LAISYLKVCAAGANEKYRTLIDKTTFRACVQQVCAGKSQSKNYLTSTKS